MNGADLGLVVSLTITVSAAIGALVGAAAASAGALFWRLRAQQLLSRLRSYRETERQAEALLLDFTEHRRGRADRAQETTTPG